MSLSLDGASDAELVALARGGQQAAFRALTNRHRDAVYRLARGAVGDADEALDVTQEAFISAFGAIGRYDPARPFRAWIARITLNKARDALRRRTVRRLFSFALPEDGPDPVDPAVPADIVVADREAWARAQIAIAALPPRLKEVLLLRTIEDMTQAEVAATLDISEKAVETRLYRARRTLSSILENN